MTSLRSFSELLERIAAHDGRMLVGVVGPPGSGKSTVAAEIVAALGPEAMALGMDGFHLAQNRLVELGSRERMGAADTFDVVAFVETLTRLRAGGVPCLPRFSTGTPKRRSLTRSQFPRPCA